MNDAPKMEEIVEFLEKLDAWDGRWAEMEAEYGNHIHLADELPDLLDEMVGLREKRMDLMRRYRLKMLLDSGQQELFDA